MDRTDKYKYDISIHLGRLQRRLQHLHANDTDAKDATTREATRDARGGLPTRQTGGGATMPSPPGRMCGVDVDMETMKRQLSTVMRQYTERSRRPVSEQISPVHPVGSCGHRTSTTSLFKTLRRKRRRFIRKRSNKT